MQLELMGQLVSIAPASHDEVEHNAHYLCLLIDSGSECLAVLEAYRDKNGLMYFKAGYEVEIYPKEVTPLVELVGAEMLEHDSKETQMIIQQLRD
ncbi:VHS1115 protein [Vibrio phage 1]|nr:VHS1115 protein [Vibrio phage 1]